VFDEMAEIANQNQCISSTAQIAAALHTVFRFSFFLAVDDHEPRVDVELRRREVSERPHAELDQPQRRSIRETTRVSVDPHGHDDEEAVIAIGVAMAPAGHSNDCD
jgi:hypothetical protein